MQENLLRIGGGRGGQFELFILGKKHSHIFTAVPLGL